MSDLRIHAALSPRVAVLSSPDVDRVVQLNGIPDLPTLLRPFESSVERLSVRTSQLETRMCDRFPLRFDAYSLFNPDAARAISSSHSQALPRPSAVGRSTEELLDQINQLIANNIKKWHTEAPRTPSTAQSLVRTKNENGDEDDEDSNVILDETLAKLQQGSIQDTAPWFTEVQQLIFGQRTIGKHESFGHPVAVLMAVSSVSPDPMNDFAKLYEATTQASPFPVHPYINPDTLKYYVLIHDVRTSGADLGSSKEILEQIKKTYGLHCCLLAINSASDERVAPPAQLASLWSPFLPSSSGFTIPKSDSEPLDVGRMLDEEDVKRIKGFIRELTAQSIVPFMERYVQHMGDHLANSRKGLTNRLFGASRKLFGGVGGSGDKSGSGSPATSGLAVSGGYDSQHEFYAYHSIEAQTRRLADFAFTIRDYKLAASMYDLGRKDFAGDKAYRHAAGATEMFGLSHLMIMYISRSAPIDVDSYLAQACYEYGLRSPARANTPGADDHHALRATLLYYEAYRMLDYLRPAPAGLLRMSLKSDEVLAPLLLEQAALACLRLRPRPSLRKYALYLVTAAHKYQACGQKILSLRCYAQAGVVYREKGWVLIENHIEHELGMQAYNEGDSDAAVAHLIKLIRPSANLAAEHEGFLRDVQTAYKYSGQAEQDDGALPSEDRTKILVLPFPVFDIASAALRFVPESSASATSAIDEAAWRKLEQELEDNGLGERTLPDGTKKRRKRPTSQTLTHARQVPMNQTFWLDLEARNPLSVDVTVDRIRPVLKARSLQANNAGTGESLTADEFECEDTGKIALGPLQHCRVRVAVRVKKEFKGLRVASVTFRLADAIELVQHLDKKGKRLNGTKEQRTGVVYGPDLSLSVSVHGARPTLTARIVDAPERVLLGELVQLKVLLKNEGSTPIEDVRALCDQPEIAMFDVEPRPLDADVTQHTSSNQLGPGVPLYVLDRDGGTQLQSGQQVEAKLVVRPVRTGDVSVAWLLAFSSEDGETYLSRMAFCTHVSSAVQISVETKPYRGTACIHDAVVEATNTLTHEQVRLDALTILSPRWRLVSDWVETSGVVIAPKQIWRGRLRIEAVARAEDDVEEERYTATKLQDILLSRDTRRPAPSDVKLHVSSQTYHDGASHRSSSVPSLVLHGEARRVWRARSLASAFPTLSMRDRNGAFTLWENGDVDVLAQFSVISQDQAERVVEAQVYGLQPGPARSQIRLITHPQISDVASKGGQIRSLYAETIKEKANVLQNMLSSRLNLDQNPTVVYVEPFRPEPTSNEASRWKFVVRNFSDRYDVQVEVQLSEAVGKHSWIGRKTLRCTLEPGSAAELVATRKGDGGGVRFVVISESYISCGSESKSLVSRYIEHY